jgi:cob(I)alamin adenosyltransferase
MTVAQYALLGHTPHLGYLGRESGGDRDLVDDTLDRLDALQLRDRQLGHLSGGERQRIVIARALVQRARILLLDEPTSSLDIGHQQEVLELVWALRRDHRLTVVGAMHDLTLAGQFADRVVLLAGGRVVGSGTPGDVLTERSIGEHYRASVDVIEDGPVRVVVPRRRGAAAAAPRLEPVTAPEPPPRRRARSLVVLNTGDGKGKSTAGFGIVMRSVARDWRVIVIQFVKSGRWKTGEEKVCRQLGVEWWSVGDGFTWDSSDLSETEAIAREAWRSAAGVIAAGAHDLVMLDELTYPINWGWIAEDEVVAAIRDRPERVNVVVTGRSAPAGLVAVADTATEMHKLRHAYDSGVIARRGIDF